jgi:S1-C subfamily serine protease
MLATVAVLATTVCCAAQTKVPPPGPLTKNYSALGVSFRYPNNWVVDDAWRVKEITVAPSSAFVKKADGHSFVTHGFFFGFVKDTLLSKSTDELTTLLLELAHEQGGQAPKGRAQLTHVDNGSCGEILNADTPYAGTETVMVCALRVGNAYIETQMFSPTAEWRQYKDIFSRILSTFAADVVPPPGPLTAEYTFPGVASFRYPNNWIVGNDDASPFISSQALKTKDDGTPLFVGPPSAFYKVAGHRLMTHGFVAGISKVAISTDKAMALLLESGSFGQSLESQKSPPQPTHVENGSCAEQAFEGLTAIMCTLQVGNAHIWALMFSPRADLSQYKDVFSRMLGTFSAVIGSEPNHSVADTATNDSSTETSTGASPLLTGREISQAAFPAMVTLVMRNKDGHSVSLGSGFFVAPRHVATNFHVVRDTTSGIAKRIGKEESLGVLGFVAVDPINDIAILEVSDSCPSTLSIAGESSVSIGDTIYAIGSPEGFEGTFSQGLVSGVRERKGARLLQITAPMSPGSSGGPILDQNAKVVGISVATYSEGQNLNFAVPSAYLLNLLAHTSALQPLSALPAAPRRGRR